MGRLMHVGVSALIPLVCASALAYGGEAPANIHPTIGQVSEEVAREKLKSYGITNVQKLQRVGNHFEIQAEHEGKPVELHMDGLSGHLRDKRTGVAIAPSSRVRDLMIQPQPGVIQQQPGVIQRQPGVIQPRPEFQPGPGTGQPIERQPVLPPR